MSPLTFVLGGVGVALEGRMDDWESESQALLRWVLEMSQSKKWGPSPVSAAKELKCARPTIDDLVRIGVLERSAYESNGHSIIMISSRSIARAKENKRVTGRWAGILGAKHEYGS